MALVKDAEMIERVAGCGHIVLEPYTIVVPFVEDYVEDDEKGMLCPFDKRKNIRHGAWLVDLPLSSKLSSCGVGIRMVKCLDGYWRAFDYPDEGSGVWVHNKGGSC